LPTRRRVPARWPRARPVCLGLGFAIWARVHIGRNWGTPMTQKDEPELVTSGPYHLVRHPIYSGSPSPA
jgi:protein-S-isoprenylcysteine O-methyltransferase Ste14